MFRLILLGAAMVAPPATAGAQQIQSGQWAFTGKVISAKIPGAPPQVVQMMTARPQTHSTCLTPEQAKADPRSLLQQSKGKCSYAKFRMAGGKIDSVMTCKSEAGPATVAVTGTYTATTYETRSTITSDGPKGKMTMVVDGTGKRTGACRK